MRLRSFAIIGLTFVLVTGLDPRAGAEDFTESWYLSRGRTNMEIENYKAAIEAYEKVVERDPNHREAMRNLGLAYEKQGLKDKAIETFDRYLAKYDDDPEIAFDQAQALEWSRYAYREKDMLKYYRMGLKRKDDSTMRLKYATHLAQHKESSQDAIAQYDKVLERQPRNPEAHRGGQDERLPRPLARHGEPSAHRSDGHRQPKEQLRPRGIALRERIPEDDDERDGGAHPDRRG